MRAAESIRDKNEEREMTNSLRIFSPDGRLVWNSPNAVAQTPVPNHVFEQVHLGNSLHETAETLDGRWSVRQLFVPIPRKGPVRHVLQAEASLRLYRETLIGLVILDPWIRDHPFRCLDRQWVAGQESDDSDRGVEYRRRNDIGSRSRETTHFGFALRGIPSSHPGVQFRHGPVPTEW